MSRRRRRSGVSGRYFVGETPRRRQIQSHELQKHHRAAGRVACAVTKNAPFAYGTCCEIPGSPKTRHSSAFNIKTSFPCSLAQTRCVRITRRCIKVHIRIVIDMHYRNMKRCIQSFQLTFCTVWKVLSCRSCIQSTPMQQSLTTA